MLLRRSAFAPPLALRLFAASRVSSGVPRASLATVVSPSTPPPPPSESGTETKPGLLDATHGFREGASVAFWRHKDPRKPGELQQLVRRLRQDSAASPTAASYYAYCLGRTAYFSAQGLLGINAYNARKRTSTRRNIDATASFVEAGHTYRDDWLRIASGVHKTPWDASLRHRQNHPINMLRGAAAFVGNAVDTLGRRDNAATADTSVWLDSPSFPDYYRQTFHFQRDGWLSARSASAYEISTETLFVGRQDAMQRLALVGLKDIATAVPQPHIVELGAGTGRLATFILDNYPAASLTLSDLSPFYLAKARDNVSYWQRFTKRSADVRYLQAPAERLPLEAEAADAVLAVYLFHELPHDARRAVAEEAYRVLRPGGAMIFVDSVQLGDRFDRDHRIDSFENFNEPHWSSYVREDIGALFKDVGFLPAVKEVSSVTKLLTFTKPDTS